MKKVTIDFQCIDSDDFIAGCLFDDVQRIIVGFVNNELTQVWNNPPSSSGGFRFWFFVHDAYASKYLCKVIVGLEASPNDNKFNYQLTVINEKEN